MATITKQDEGLLPYNLAAEEAVIGSLLMDPDAVFRVREVDLKPSDFFRGIHGDICQAAYALADREVGLDIVTVSDAVPDISPADLTALLLRAESSVHAGHYATIVKRCAQQRKLISVAGDIAAAAHRHDGPIDELYDTVSRAFFDAVDVSDPQSHLYGNAIQRRAYEDNQVRRAEMLARDPDALIATGMGDLDTLLGSVPPGYLHVVVARPGVGKTMYMEQVAEHNARRGKKVVFYHLELTHQFMLDRRMARHTGVSVGELMRGYQGPEIARANDNIGHWDDNVVYVHCPGWSAERIASDISRLYAKGECDLAIVDYLQKLRLPESKNLNPAMLIGQQAETLKVVAEQKEIPIIMGSQVSRSFKTRGDQRPRMEDIRNSGEIEEKANQIVVLHCAAEREEGARIETEAIEAYVEKNTMGRVGKVNLTHVVGRYTLACGASDSDLETIPF